MSFEIFVRSLLACRMLIELGFRTLFIFINCISNIFCYVYLVTEIKKRIFIWFYFLNKQRIKQTDRQH
jgi:hypothetical protein